MRTIDARGNTTTMVYNGNRELTDQYYPDGRHHRYDYDLAGNRTLVEDATGVTTSTYDSRNNLLSVTNPDGKTVSYSYDGCGQCAVNRRHTMTDPEGGVYTYSYDEAGQLIELVDPRGQASFQDYDLGGRLVRRQAGNGAVTSFVYDCADRLKQLQNHRSDGTPVNIFTYTYDRAGHRTSALELSGDLTTWTYDPAYQLVHEQRSGTHEFSVTYTYDPAGNRTLQDDAGERTTYTYDAANQLLTEESSAGLTTYVYDESGNRIEKNAPAETTYYTWNEDSRLVAVEPPAGVTTLVYNADGLRVGKQSPSEATKFIYDFRKLLQETDGADDPQRWYTFTTEEYGDLVSQYDGADTLYHQYDGLGSTDALLDEWETATDRYAHRAFGLEAARSGTTDNPFTYVGRQSYYKDPELELYLLGARYYDPQAGRFVSEDPLRYQSDDVNLYAYVHNNPVNGTDPSGQAEIVYRASGVYMKTTTGVQIRIGTAEMEQQFFLGIFWGIGPKSGTKTRLLDEFGGWEFDNSVWQENALEITVRLFERYLPEPASQLSGDDLKFYARWYLSNRGHFGLEEQRREAQRRMDREGYIGSEFSGANRRPTARYQQPESPPPASATPAALVSGSAANRSAVPRDGAPSDGYDAKLAAATRIAQRVPDFEEFHSEKAWKSYEAWKAAAGLACLDAVESASQSPDFGMTPAEVRILFGVWDAIARAHYNPVNPNDRKISAAPVHSPGYQAWLDARNARWEHKAQLDWAFDPKNEHDPRAGKIRADHYVARGYVVGWVGYKAPRSDIQLIFKAFGYVPVVGIPALLADATVHAYHGEHEEAVLSGFAAISEIALLAWAARVKPVQQIQKTVGAPTRRITDAVRHRGGNRQVLVGNQRWHLPKDTPTSRIPIADPVGDQLQRAASQAAQRWNRSLLSPNEALAVRQAHADGKHWLGNLLERQARGRWVEGQVRQQFPQLNWSRTGADVVDPATRIRYDILSGTRYNMDLHAQRMADVLFRMITF